MKIEMNVNYTDLSKMVDHAVLSPTLTPVEVSQNIDLAIAYDVASVCIMPCLHKGCAERLRGTGVRSSSVVGFPHGVHTKLTKLAEASQLLEEGCEELDVVCNYNAVLAGNWSLVEDEIAAVTRLIHGAGQKVKIIFENCYLKDYHKVQLCKICCEIGVDWVKTSTGFGTGGATKEDLQLMLKHVSAPVQVKAAGGIKDLEMLLEVREMGVTRVGASRTSEILGDLRKRLGLSPISILKNHGASGGY